MASRRVIRLTPSRAASSRSGGNRSPRATTPSLIADSSRSTVSSNALPVRTGRKTASAAVAPNPVASGGTSGWGTFPSLRRRAGRGRPLQAAASSLEPDRRAPAPGGPCADPCRRRREDPSRAAVRRASISPRTGRHRPARGGAGVPARGSEAVMERTAPHPAGRRTALTVLVWLLQVLIFALSMLVGVGKLTSWPDHVQVFEQIGMGQWLRYAVGAAEVAGAVLLLVPRLAGLAAIGLAVIVAGAVLTHLFILVDAGWVLPAVLTVVLLLIAWIRRRETLSLIGR